MALCDVYSALRELRPHKVPRSHEQAMHLLPHGDHAADGEHSGQFDLALIAVLTDDPDLFRDAFDASA